jgi:uncharacterized protein
MPVGTGPWGGDFGGGAIRLKFRARKDQTYPMIEPNMLGGLVGGALIGLASTLMLLLLGRITGISGILGGVVVWMRTQDLSWRTAFIVGLVLGAGAYRLIWGDLPLQMQSEGFPLIAAGLLVGAGTRLGSGCTSGHGVCGMARRSKRSFTATLTFMVVAAITVFIIRHVLP